MQSPRERLLAVTDLETTGMDERVHEIIEIGLILVRQDTLEEVSSWTAKVRPEHIENADPKSLEVNGFDAAAWKDAIPLEEAIREYASRTKGAMMLAHNMVFDWKFLNAACQKTGVAEMMDYHRIDLFTAAYERLRGVEMPGFKLDHISVALGLRAEAHPHGAMNGARQALMVYRALHALPHS